MQHKPRVFAEWRLCDDSRVNFVQESRVVHEQAYLLLYRRRGDTFQIQRSVPSPVNPTKEGTTGADESNSDGDDAFEPMSEPPSGEEAGAKSTPLEPMEESTVMSLSSVSQISSSGSSEPPSTVQEELD